jgi:hypothetical protein
MDRGIQAKNIRQVVTGKLPIREFNEREVN